MAVKGKGEKQFKIIIREDKDPELYAWIHTLPYGSFPKNVIETLRWMEEKGLLIRGGVVPPDRLLESQNPPLYVPPSPDLQIQKEILDKVNQLTDLLKQSHHRLPENTLQPLPISEPVQESFIQQQTTIVADVHDSASELPIEAVPSPFRVFKAK